MQFTIFRRGSTLQWSTSQSCKTYKYHLSGHTIVKKSCVRDKRQFSSVFPFSFCQNCVKPAFLVLMVKFFVEAHDSHLKSSHDLLGGPPTVWVNI
jgi:hypothetical protein